MEESEKKSAYQPGAHCRLLRTIDIWGSGVEVKGRNEYRPKIEGK